MEKLSVNGIKPRAGLKGLPTTEDPFSKFNDASDIGKLSGISDDSRNELHKKAMGSGAGSAAIHEIQGSPFGYQAFDIVEPPYSLETLAKLYDRSVHHHAAVDAKISNVVGLGYKLIESRKTKLDLEDMADDDDEKRKKFRRKLNRNRESVLLDIESWSEDETLTQVLTKVWADYETMGNGYLEVARKADGTIGYIGHIQAHTLRIRRKRDGFVQIVGNQVQFFANYSPKHKTDRPSNPLGGGRPSELIHFKKYSPASGYYGVPSIVSAESAIAGANYATQYNLDFFRNRAEPRNVIIVKGASMTPETEAKIVEFFSDIRGENHRSIVVPLPADTETNKVSFEIQKVGGGIEDSSFKNYRKANLEDVLMAHRVPINKVSVGEGLSLAVARDADKTFKENVCRPVQEIVEKQLNRIVSELTQQFTLKLEETSLTDENTQSQIDERRIKTGTDTPNEQRAARGLPAVEGGDTLYDMNKKSGTTVNPNRERDAQRSAGATDSIGEGRNPKGEGRVVE